MHAKARLYTEKTYTLYIKIWYTNIIYKYNLINTFMTISCVLWNIRLMSRWIYMYVPLSLFLINRYLLVNYGQHFYSWITVALWEIRVRQPKFSLEQQFYSYIFFLRRLSHSSHNVFPPKILYCSDIAFLVRKCVWSAQ